MESKGFSIVTGAFGYTGKYITSKLLSMGEEVRTITGHQNRENTFGTKISVSPFNFDEPRKLVDTIKGAKTLYNTYWVRFDYKETTFDKAINNTKILIRAAEEAGVKRFVHVSIANPSLESNLPYYKGKAMLENAITSSSLSYAIVRPTLIFGLEDILINNIAWLLRKFPIFAIPGKGDYLVQPIFVGDYANIAIEAAQQKDNTIIDAVGPEIFSFDQMVCLIAKKIRSNSKIIHLSPGISLFLSKIISKFIGDVLLTKDEVKGLMSNLLVSNEPPRGQVKLSNWLDENANKVGAKRNSELERHYR
ncbi:MAG: NAD(P)H-binding protein [Spirochaetota bacterium]|nr:NAD(P)H-binding protein [Spirochaetota bacterium]